MDHRKAITRHRAMLSPLRFGAGIKGKVLESWGTGTPVIGTWLTFEGMGEAGILGNDADSLISLSVRLHQNETLWLEEQNRGLQNLELRFSRKRLKARFLQFLKNLPPVNSHLTGAMLRHQHSNSLKYFSRWIEAKSSKAIARHGED